MFNAMENQEIRARAGGFGFLQKTTSQILMWLGCASGEELESLSARVQHLEELLDVVARQTSRLSDKIENPEKHHAQEECRERIG